MSQAAAPSAPGVDASRGRILIVDDDPSIRFSLEALLGDDFEVQTADAVAAAEEILKGKSFDVVLSDYDMPGETGMEFLRRVNARSPGTMGILVTGHSDHPDVRAAEKDQTIVRVISKPYDPARLIKWVENTVRLARMRQAMNALANRAVRAPLALSVDYPSDPNSRSDLALNLSVGGLFLRTERSLRPGQLLKLRLSFPGVVDPFEVTAEVRWRQTEINAPPGYGIAFKDVSAEVAAEVEALIKRHTVGPRAKVTLAAVPKVPATVAALVSGSSEAGLAAESFATLAALTEALRTRQFDAALVDLSETRNGAKTAVLAVRAVARTLPLILIQAAGEPAFSGDPALLCVQQPVDPASLVRTLRAAIEKKAQPAVGRRGGPEIERGS